MSSSSNSSRENPGASGRVKKISAADTFNLSGDLEDFPNSSYDNRVERQVSSSKQLQCCVAPRRVLGDLDDLSFLENLVITVYRSIHCALMSCFVFEKFLLARPRSSVYGFFMVMLASVIVSMVITGLKDTQQELATLRRRMSEHHESSNRLVDTRVDDVYRNVRNEILRALATFDADKTGLPDLALEMAGGSILGWGRTKWVQSKFSGLSFYGIQWRTVANHPRKIIQPGTVPGTCWAIDGEEAEVVIGLAHSAIIHGFTMEHIPKSLSATGRIDSAPKVFQVYGIKEEDDADLDTWDFGEFEYTGERAVHYFNVKRATRKDFSMIRLRIISNHGNPQTCIYRFRVHGAVKNLKTGEFYPLR